MTKRGIQILQNTTVKEIKLVGDEKTLIKLVVDSRSDRVLGAHRVGEGAVEIIQCLALALRIGATKQNFDEAIGIHRNFAEEFLTLR